MSNPNLVLPADGEVHQLGTLGARLMYRAPDGSLSIVEHPIKPRGLAAPVHTHVNEDEYSFVIEGNVGFQLAGDVMTAGPGAFVAKPRNIPHAFWNAGDEPARVLELICPAGFEQYFVEMAAAFPKDGPPGPDNFAKFMEISGKYDLDIDFQTVAQLAQEHNLQIQ